MNYEDFIKMEEENKCNADWIRKTYADKKVYVYRVETDRTVFIKSTGVYPLEDLIKELETDSANFTTDKEANESHHEELNKWTSYGFESISFMEFEYID